MDNKEQSKIMSVESLIALCHILDEYKKFDNSIQTVMTDKNYIKVANDLCKASQSSHRAGGRIARELYRENKHTIDTINEYSNINCFLYYNSNWHKNAYSRTNIKYDLDYFYDYFTNNKKKLRQIRSVLTKIKKIGIKNLEFNKNLDFTKNTYELYFNFATNNKFYYVDNMEIIPNYDTNKVKYITTDSPYEISTTKDHHSWAVMKDDISKRNMEIKINDLTFDKDRLPNMINKKVIFDNILYLKRKISGVCNNIKNYVDISIDIEDLKEIYNQLIKDISNIDDLDYNENIHKTLIQVSEGIKSLETISDSYKDYVIINNDNISEEKIEEEKSEEKTLRKNKLYNI